MAIYRENATDVAILLGILIVASIASSGISNIPRPTRERDSDIDGGISISVLSMFDVHLHNIIEPAFLMSEQAIENEVTDIVWLNPSNRLYYDYLISGEVDIIWLPYGKAIQEISAWGLLDPLNYSFLEPRLNSIEDSLSHISPTGYDSMGSRVWVTACMTTREFGCMVNNEFLDTRGIPVPSHTRDLISPDYFDTENQIPAIAVTEDSFDPANYQFGLMTQFQLGWADGLTTRARIEGSAKLYPSNSKAMSAVANGSSGVAVIDSRNAEYPSSSENIKFRLLYDLPPIIYQDVVAITRTSFDREVSAAFIEFLLSDSGQSLWLNHDTGHLPVVESAYFNASKELKRLFQRIKKSVNTQYNHTLESELMNSCILYHRSVFQNLHNELVSCWSAIVTAFHEGYITIEDVTYYASLMAQPMTITSPIDGATSSFTIDFARELNSLLLHNSTLYLELGARWHEAAVSRYAEIFSLVMTEFN